MHVSEPIGENLLLFSPPFQDSLYDRQKIQ